MAKEQRTKRPPGEALAEVQDEMARIWFLASAAYAIVKVRTEQGDDLEGLGLRPLAEAASLLTDKDRSSLWQTFIQGPPDPHGYANTRRASIEANGIDPWIWQP